MSPEIALTLERLAEKAVLANMRDLRAVGDLHSDFLEISCYCRNNDKADIGTVAQEAADLAEAIILGNIQFQDSISNISQAVDWLKSKLLDPCSENDYILPDGEDCLSFKKIVEEYCTECKKHLENINNAISYVNFVDKPCEYFENAFKSFHSIRGVSGFLGFNSFNILAHETENLLDMICSSKVRPKEELIQKITDSSSLMKELIDTIKGDFFAGIKKSQNPDDIINKQIQVIKDACLNFTGDYHKNTFDPKQDLEKEIK